MFITMAPNPSKFTPRAQACVFVGYPLHQGGYKCFHPSSRKDFVSMDVTFLEDRPFFPVSHLQGESESEESNSNWVISLESTSPTLVTIPSPDSHYTVLPTNQVPWKTYYRRNLRKEVGSPANQPAPVQDSEPLRDQGMTDSIDSHIDSKMSESDRSETAIPENIGEQGNVDTEVILDGKGSNDENEVSARVTQNSIREDRSENLSQLDPSLYLPIALRKGTRFCTKHFIANYLSYENLSPQFRAFTASLDSTVIPKNIHIALDCPEWKNAVMEEMRALEKNKTWEICGLPRSGST